MYSVHQERLTCQKRERQIGSRRLEDRPDKCEQDVLGQADSWTVDTNGISWSATHTHTGTHMDACCLRGELQSHKDKREREREAASSCSCCRNCFSCRFHSVIKNPCQVCARTWPQSHRVTSFPGQHYTCIMNFLPRLGHTHTEPEEGSTAGWSGRSLWHLN